MAPGFSIGMSARNKHKLRERRRALDRQQQELQRQIEQLEERVASAPARVSAYFEEQKTLLHARAASQTSLYDGRVILADKRFCDAPEEPYTERPIRIHVHAERRLAISRALGLLVLLAILILWLRSLLG